MTSMSQPHHHHHHQAMTSWHTVNASPVTGYPLAATTTASTQYQSTSREQQLETTQSYQQLGTLDMTTDSTQSSTSTSSNNQQQYLQQVTSGSPSINQQQFYQRQATSSPRDSLANTGEAATYNIKNGRKSPVATKQVSGNNNNNNNNQNLHQTNQHHTHQMQHLQDGHQHYPPANLSEAMYHQPHAHHHHQHQQIHHQQRAANAATNLYYEPVSTNYHATQDQSDYYQSMIHQQPQPQLQQQHHHQQHHQHLRAAALASIDSFHANNQIAGVGQQQAAACNWPVIAQSTSPQIATSPAINNHHHPHHQFQSANQPSPVSPLYANTNTTYTNGYPSHSQAVPNLSQQQHYPALAHQPSLGQHNHSIVQTSSPSHQHLAHHHQHHHQQHEQHDNKYQINQTQQMSHTNYSQFTATHRAPVIHSPLSKTLNSPTAIHATNNNPSQPQNHQVISAQHPNSRHYGGGNNATAKVTATVCSAESAVSRSSSTGGVGGINLSPKSNHSILPSPTGTNRIANYTSCGRQSSSVMSTGSAGSNLSDHVSQTESPPGISNQDAQILATIRPDADRVLSTESCDTKSEIKESQLSQLHQQCAVLLDEQQQHSVAINQVISNNSNNNNGTNASNSSNINDNTGTNNTSSNGNSGSGRSKRLRTSFKHNQLKEMKRWFSKNQNPDAKDLKTLAQHTGLSKRVLQVWFQNARAKFRRNNAKAASQQIYDANQHATNYMLHFQQQSFQHHHLAAATAPPVVSAAATRPLQQQAADSLVVASNHSNPHPIQNQHIQQHQQQIVVAPQQQQHHQQQQHLSQPASHHHQPHLPATTPTTTIQQEGPSHG